ncbi:putative 4-hydroxybenzoate polyprenyltransferase [Solitalea sp. MAHUQ-68]|uniref:4-hydroxybenzoate polyprenyltransferase n=1 Tax=Solitalea agri TaxID=2953739 RepID=A0A9X2JD45_9SPHI|nr:UbiA-like polyprenyltransferase [Solitalea agri]MCO4293214.1 putative 4-hydroxybenzoate polyprenyltransferase [Solitalea agri]
MKNYLSLIKFSHTIFAMPFAIIGFVLAVSVTNAEFDWKKFVLMIACMVFARSAAMAFNRYIDREFDAKNPRTKVREIPAGVISAKNALVFTIVNCLAFIVTTYFINSLCFFLSPVALIVVLGYSYTKRFTSFCHLVLGLGLSLAPIGAYLVVTGEFALLPILFSLAVITWVSGFDIIYALQDEDFDRSQKLHSIPEWLGTKGALNFSSVLHVLSTLFVIAAGLVGNFGVFYWVGVIGYSGMLIYQHSVVKPSDLSRVNLAFMTANGIASVGFALFFLADTYIKL